MAYEARRNNNSGGNSQGKEMTEDERNIKNNTENLRNAADVAMATTTLLHLFFLESSTRSK